MKILEQIEEIFNQYELEPIDLEGKFPNVYRYLDIYPHELQKFMSDKHDSYLVNKYREHIPQGWYGFAIGHPIIPEWCEIIDKTLELCIQIDPDFEIHQIKLKFGRICFYVFSDKITDTHDVEVLFANRLYDRALIW